MAIWLVLVLGVTACGGSDDDRGVVDEESALEVVEAAYQLYNSGDLEGWIEVRNRGSFFASEEDREGIMEWARDLYGGEMEAGAQYEELGCTSHGLGEWPVADTGPVTGYYFTCDSEWISGTQDPTSQVNHFEWVVSEGPDGAVVAVRTSGAG
jgi:hypothetical protein